MFIKPKKKLLLTKSLLTQINKLLLLTSLFTNKIIPITFRLVVFCVFNCNSFTNDTTIISNNHTESVIKIKKSKNSLIVAPLVSRTLETSWSFGLAGAYIFKTNKRDSSLRTSTIPMGLLYTLNNQIIGGLGANIFLPKEAYIIRFESSFSKFPDKFWGIGNSTDERETKYEEYTFSQVFINPQFYKRIRKYMYVGIGYNMQTVFSIDTNLGTRKPKLPKSYFGQDKVEGIYNNPDGKYIVSGIELIFSIDSRNHAYVPTKGELLRIRLNNYLSILGSDYQFPFLDIDFRKFFKVYKKSTFGVASYMLFNFGDKIPFRNLGTLGGRNNMRGYYDGRFRDNKYITFQGEYRFPIWWRFGGVVFLGFGQVAHEFKDFNLQGFKVSAGGGLRFSILPKEMLNLRLDYGFGMVGSGAISIVLAESF